jgi:hypothetical protein
MTNETPRLGSSSEAFLLEQGIAEDVNGAAIKHVLAWQIEEAMKKQGISKNQMAKRMRTSGAYLDRFLDPTMTRFGLTQCSAPPLPSAANLGWTWHEEAK